MLTLSMIVKNEEFYLKDCLESVKGVVDEIVLVDTGSTDLTKSIAESYNAKIYDFKWVNDFSAARNFALSKSTGDWILYLDADERLSENSIQEIKRLTATKEKKAYFCSIVSNDDIQGRQSTFTYLRLFANSKEIEFYGNVHEQIESSLIKNSYKIENSDLVIFHVGYNVNQEGLERKAKRNLELLLKEFNKNPSSYNAYQIAQTYGILKNQSEAGKYFTIALKDKSLKNEYKSLAYRFLSVNATDMSDFTTAKELIEKSLQCDKEQPLALLIAAKICCKLNSFAEAERYTKNAFEVNNMFLDNKKKSAQTIYLQQEDFCYHALEISVSTHNVDLYNYFFQKLFNYSSGKMSTEKRTEFDFFNYLLNDNELLPEQITQFAEIINNRNFSMVMEMLKNYKPLDSRVRLYYALYQTRKSDPVFLNEFGIFLSEIKQFDAAKEVFESAYNLNPENPSTVFFLVSIYINTKNFDKISPLINSAKNIFSKNPQIIERLITVEQKLTGII